MKLRFKEHPREWRNSVLFTVLGLGLISGVLRWRHVLTGGTWLAALAFLALLAVAACLAPRWFRGYYRVSLRLGAATSQVVVRVVLMLLFFLVITPLGLIFRVMGKDALHLKRQVGAKSYWSLSRAHSPLDRLF